MPSPRFPIPQGTLVMLILLLEPAHGYRIAQRLEQRLSGAANLTFEEANQ